jgi:hypothetical protein
VNRRARARVQRCVRGATSLLLIVLGTAAARENVEIRTSPDRTWTVAQAADVRSGAALLSAARDGAVRWQRELAFDLDAFDVGDSGRVVGLRHTGISNRNYFYLWVFDSRGERVLDWRVLDLEPSASIACSVGPELPPHSPNYVAFELHDGLGIAMLRYDSIESDGTGNGGVIYDEIWMAVELADPRRARVESLLDLLERAGSSSSGRRAVVLEAQAIPGTSNYFVLSLLRDAEGSPSGLALDFVDARGFVVATFLEPYRGPELDDGDFRDWAVVDTVEALTRDEHGPLVTVSHRACVLREPARAIERRFELVPTADPCRPVRVRER